MNIYALLALVWVHFIADFILQTDQMAMNKSRSNYWLTVHVLSYVACFVPICVWFKFKAGFILTNLAAHWVTDYVSSRLTTKCWIAWKEGNERMRHMFFVVIGADQALHMTALVLTYFWIGTYD